MLNAKIFLLFLLGVVGLTFCLFWGADVWRRKSASRPTLFHLTVGFITDFLDTLGIGSYASTTSLYRFRKTVDDAQIPGTLNVGHALPTIVQAFIYITAIHVEIRTLCFLIGSSVLGAWLGAGVVTRLPRRAIQISMGVAMLVAAALILYRIYMGEPADQGTSGLVGWLLLTACIGNFVFGSLMTIGVGAYAPIMIMVSLLGMNPITAFPVMMGSCAFLMPAAGVQFIRSNRYDPRAALGLTLAGVPAVFLAAMIVWRLPLEIIRWLVVVVVVYTAVSMLWSGLFSQLSARSSDEW